MTSSISAKFPGTIFPPNVTSWCVITIGGVVTCFYIYMTSFRNKNKKLPPTPGVALLLIGHLHLLKKDPLPKFREWQKSLGDIFMLKVGSYPMVVINGHRLIKDVFVKQGDIFSDRPSNFFEIIDNLLSRGIVLSSGLYWKERRKTSLAILREFGMGKNVLAKNVTAEVEIYLQTLADYNEELTDLRPPTHMSISNNICAILFGERFELDDPEFKQMMDSFEELGRKSGCTGVAMVFPWFKYLPFDLVGIKDLKKTKQKVIDFITSMCNDKIEQLDSSTMNSFIDSYIREIGKKEASGTNTYLRRMDLEYVILDLFIAGTDTTATVIMWCYCFLIQNPNVQEKLFEEISSQVGDRSPTLEDKPNLKYLGAVILETLRMANIGPQGFLHSTNYDAVVDGYIIPKGTIVIPNLDSVLMAEEVWADPEEFRPERFLDSDGNLQNREELLPFGLGKRACLGESMASMELFLYLASVVQRFKLFAEDSSDFDVKPSMGAIRSPMPFKLRCVAR